MSLYKACGLSIHKPRFYSTHRRIMSKAVNSTVRECKIETGNTIIKARKEDIMDQIKIGKFIAAERKNKGYTQKLLAEILGISDKTISKWERGESHN